MAKRSIKKQILIAVSTVVVLLLTSILETRITELETTRRKALFDVPAGQKSQIEKLLVSYSEKKRYVPYDASLPNLPFHIKAKGDITVRAFSDTYFHLKKGTELQTIIFRQNRLHLKLVNGEMIMDTTFTMPSVTVQVKNILIKPFENGIFYVSNNSVKSLKGQAILGIFNEGETLEDKILLGRSRLLNLQNFQIDKKAADIDLNGLNHDKVINNMRLFTLKYKGKKIVPDSSQGILSSMVSILTFNSKKRDTVSMYPFVKNLYDARRAYFTGDTTRGEVALTKAKEEFEKNTQNLDLFKKKVNEDFTSLIGLSVEDKLNPLKRYMIDNHLELIDNELLLETGLSLLEDTYMTAERSDLNQSVKVLDLWLFDGTTVTKDSLEFVLKTLDNLITDHSVLNVKKVFEFREKLFDKLAGKAQDETELVEMKNDFEKANEAHLDRLRKLYEQDKLNADSVKENAIILLGSVDTLRHLKYQDFIRELNIEGVGMNF